MKPSMINGSGTREHHFCYASCNYSSRGPGDLAHDENEPPINNVVDIMEVDE